LGARQASAPEPPRATRIQPEPILTVILCETTFSPDFFVFSLRRAEKDENEKIGENVVKKQPKLPRATGSRTNSGRNKFSNFSRLGSRKSAKTPTCGGTHLHCRKVSLKAKALFLGFSWLNPNFAEIIFWSHFDTIKYNWVEPAQPDF